MIAVKIHAGLGNQLFQYAFSYALAEKHGCELLLDATYPLYYPTSSEIPPQNYHLHRFSISPSEKFLTPWLKYCHRFLPNNVIKKVYIKNQKNKLQKLGLTQIKEDISDGQSKYANLPDNCYLDGYFQYPQLFQPYRKDLVRKLIFPKPPFKNNEDKLVRSTETPVAINLRRKDYLSPRNLENHGICTINYYEKAIKYIQSRVSNATFFVISDDVSDSRKFLSSINANLHFVNDDKYKDLLSDMYLMQQCQHIVLANSSYSWWSAYLRESKEKIIIAPERWVVNNNWSQFNKTIIPSNWIRI